ncbi:MAG TPA: nickel pincer cofactor biosynthesis protein LarC [Pyrinomonadaceae bacterium]|nr:nickel pincer cofactor biosynthesis protein LarC [Pyrinomonadaceae bacterium]
MRILYFDCFAGASGNMILGALIAAGVDAEKLTDELKKLGLPEFKIQIEKVDRSGISSLHAKVLIPDEKKHRHLPEIEAIIRNSTLSQTVKDRSLAIFRRLAEAEAAVHGIELEKVHFHEVGALDAIIDIVGSCVGFEMLGIESFACSKIHVGSGFVNMAHGKFPIPPPAVAELLKNIPFYSTEIEGELITPTGAAIISTLCENYGQIPDMTLEVSGYGAGTRTYEKFPNVLRIFVGETAYSGQSETLSLLETNIDDLSPQILGHVMDKAFDAGALDCWFTAIQMKKNRPATKVSILCSADTEKALLDLLYRETSTLGVRIQRIERRSLERESTMISTEYGQIGVKTAYIDGEAVNSKPEFEDLKSAAVASGVPLKLVAEAASKANKH